MIDRAIVFYPNDAFALTTLSIFLKHHGKIPAAEKAEAKVRMFSWEGELKRNPNAPPPAGPGAVNGARYAPVPIRLAGPIR
jgi:hypothetical protein